MAQGPPERSTHYEASERKTQEPENKKATGPSKFLSLVSLMLASELSENKRKSAARRQAATWL
jgi:hypothetical protein